MNAKVQISVNVDGKDLTFTAGILSGKVLEREQCFILVTISYDFWTYNTIQTEQLSVNLRFNSDVTFSLVGGNGPVSLLGFTETVLGGLPTLIPHAFQLILYNVDSKPCR